MAQAPPTDSVPPLDYQTGIDAPTWAFIAKTDAFYPPETATYSIDRQRQIYDAMCRQFFQGYPPGLTTSDRVVGGVPCARNRTM